jgi:uncharacterized protein YabN with tetrapyrrole methylase and pyrophosphatase domain
METRAAEQGLDFEAMGLEALDRLWDESKLREQ